MDVQSFVREIVKCYPNLHVQAIQPINAGKVNDILVINDALIFRFPKTRDGVRNLLTEIAVLEIVRGRLSLPVPAPIFTSGGARSVGTVFAGHAVIAGEPLGHHTHEIGLTAQVQIADQLGGFLCELHRVPIPATVTNLPIHDVGRRESVSLLREQVHTQLAPHMSSEMQDRVTAEFDRFLADPVSFDYAPGLKHGDLGVGNILINPSSHSISGIIDFGSAGIDDPATDLGFVALWGGYLFGQDFVERVLSRYQVTQSLRLRIGFFKMAIALSVALEGLQSDNHSDVAFGLSQCI
jgi:aminoglycoside 2''-phosphotransferase